MTTYKNFLSTHGRKLALGLAAGVLLTGCAMTPNGRGGVMVGLTMLMLASGLDVVTAFTAVIGSLNNIGPGMGKVGPAGNFGVLNEFQIWVCTVAMLLGRLELLSVLVLFTPQFWRR